MSDVFLKIINMSISASWLILVVLTLRFVLKKAPKWIDVLLWGIVAIRLICPFSLESIFSLIPSAETVNPEIMLERVPAINSGVSVINSTVNPVISRSFAPAPEASANPLQIWIPILAVVWIIGIAVMFIYMAISYWRLYRRVSTAVLLRDNIFQSENVVSPFVLGILNPKICLPFQMDGKNLDYVIAHEQAHIRRRDHWWKPLGFLILTIHWFNPLIWLSYVLLCRDIEFACDEKVIGKLGREQRADYSQALLMCSAADHRMIAACPLSFGEMDVKKRVKSVLYYKKPAFWIVLAAVAVCIVVALCFLTNPKSDDGQKSLEHLTLDDVAELSEKGEALGWDDFNKFEYYETGSGLYIRVYEIDEMFSLQIGGDPDSETEPMYIYLSASDGSEDCIDIRDSGVEEFVEQHKNNPVVKECTYGWQSSPVGYSQDASGKMMELGEISEYAYMSSIQFLPVVKITSEGELKKFMEDMSSYFEYDVSYSDVPSFHDAAEEYDDEFFNSATLFLIYTSAETTADRYGIEYIRKSGEKLSIGVTVSKPEEGDTVPEDWLLSKLQSGSRIPGGVNTTAKGWLLSVGIPVEQISGITDVEAQISSVSYPDREILAGNLLKKYVFEENSETNISLYDSGEFTFSFSVMSSYLGYGTYEIENDRLTLHTDDGEFTYVFDMVGDTLVFDADASSEQIWFSGIYDGAVLK